MPIPLIELLESPTVFVLGAGASKPYGFPLWKELKAELLDIFRNPAWPKISAGDGAAWWIKALEEMDDDEDSVDKIATFAAAASC